MESFNQNISCPGRDSNWSTSRIQSTFSVESTCRDLWEAAQEIPHFLWKPKVHYFVHKIASLGHIFNQLNPLCTFGLFISFKIHFRILPYTRRSVKWFHPFIFSDKNFVRIFNVECMPHSQPINWNVISKSGMFYINRLWLEYTRGNLMFERYCIFCHCHLITSTAGR